MRELRLETERLILRPWQQADRAPFAAMNADPEVMRYFPSMQSPEQSDGVADRICAYFDVHGFGLFALEEKATGVFAGFTGFQTVPFECPVKGELEIGWRLARPFWRRGLAFEAASACMDWIAGRSGITRVVSMTASINIPSWRLMEKLGLHRCAELDFDHPAIDRESPLCRHVIYVKDRP